MQNQVFRTVAEAWFMKNLTDKRFPHDK